MYDIGRGITQDNAEAARWYKRAAAQGSASAQYNLGVMHTNGEGVIQDYVQAHMWFNLSAASGDKYSAKERGKLAEILTSAQIGKAQQMAREYQANNDANC